MTPAALLIIGAVLLTMGLCERGVRRLPLSPALVYLCVGWAVAKFGSPLAPLDLRSHGTLLLHVSEAVLLLSLFAIGLRLGAPGRAVGWRHAAVLASSGMLLTIALVTLAAHWVLALAWPAALLLAAMLAPTDPVLASEVQIGSVQDRDPVRLTLTAEGALNDGSAFPVVMLALGLLSLHPLGPWGLRWVAVDLLWLVAGGLVLGWACGRLFGHAMRLLLQRRHALAWDELIYFGSIALTYSLAELLKASTFLAVFACGCMLLAAPRRRSAHAASDPCAQSRAELCARMVAFGARVERLVEVMMVLLIGVALAAVDLSWPLVSFALVCSLVARPLAVALALRGAALPKTQRRLVAWFGIRGVGSLFYLGFALERGLPMGLAGDLVAACLVTIAASIVLHGISSTPLMNWHRKRRGGARISE